VAVIKHIQRFVIALIFLLTHIQNTFADMLAKGTTKVKTVFNIYKQSSDTGKQVYDNSGDEDADVIEPMIFIEHQINEDTAVSANIILDGWSAASDTHLDGNTGASGEGINYQGRTAVKVNLKQEKEKWAFNYGLGASGEYDYKSINGSLDASRSFAHDNATLGLSLQYYHDKVGLFKNLVPSSNVVFEEDNNRKIFSIGLNASQILTQKSILFFDANYIQAKGFLESTASSVILNGVRDLEQLPETRKRYAVSSQFVQGIGDNSSIHFDYRYYWDSWDLDAHTFKLSYFYELNENEDYIEMFVRSHNQSSVEYFGESFDSTDKFMTSDSDLSEFSSYELGLFHSYVVGDLGEITLFGKMFDESTWNNSIVYSKRDNGLSYSYFQSSFAVEF